MGWNRKPGYPAAWAMHTNGLEHIKYGVKRGRVNRTSIQLSVRTRV